MTHATLTPNAAIGTIDEALDEYGMSLRAQNKSTATITVYLTALRRLNSYLDGIGHPRSLTAIRRDHIEAFLVSLQDEGRSASTVSVYYRSLQPFWKWALEQGEIEESPMARMKPPKVPDKMVPIFTGDELDRLLATCDQPKSNRFEDVRDYAIFRLLLDTGIRRGSLAALRVGNLTFGKSTDKDPDHYATVTGKGNKTWAVAFGADTYLALKRYLRARDKHSKAQGTDALWLGYKGPLTGNGILQMMERRGEQAGVGKLFVHRWRHHRAHDWLARGGSETGLMRTMGWKSPAMLRRYGASAAEERAREEFRRLDGAKRKAK